jgi:KTSC domain-containing protein
MNSNVKNPTSLPVMFPVKSSNVDAIGHFAGSNELHVRYKDGAHYIYDDVAPELHQRLMNAPSIGKFIHEHVKGKFTHRRLVP